VITDVPGIRVGHATDAVGLTGVSVVLCETTSAADIMSRRFWKYGPNRA